ncbi:hypothetical protein GGH93_004763 [Coemansia aciculifera]|nr:hypothetical protein GGH93_004763 [Coemansia aciculifera]
MVCVICCDLLFRTLAGDEPSTSSVPTNNNQIAALTCGHTFHLECITSWHSHDDNMSCPLCKARHFGPILQLHIECDRKHVADKECGNLGRNRLFINDQATAAEQQESKYNELEATVAALQMKLDEKTDLIKKWKKSESRIYVRLARLDKLEDKLNVLSEAHKAHIRCLLNKLDLKKRTIAELEKRIREKDAGYS